jgi:hypothetical protein
MATISDDVPSPADAYSTQPPPPPQTSVPTAPPYTTPGYYAPAGPRTNVLAIISLIASCAGTFLPGAVIAGVIMGHIALSQIKRTGEGGRGLALAGVIVGYAVFGIELLAILAYIIIFVVILGAAASSGAFDSHNFG